MLDFREQVRGDVFFLCGPAGFFAINAPQFLDVDDAAFARNHAMQPPILKTTTFRGDFDEQLTQLAAAGDLSALASKHLLVALRDLVCGALADKLCRRELPAPIDGPVRASEVSLGDDLFKASMCSVSSATVRLYRRFS